MEATRTVSAYKNVSQMHYHTLGVIAKISTTIKDLKVGEVVIATTSLSTYLFGMCRRQMGLGE